jgi:hypothetical protein
VIPWKPLFTARMKAQAGRFRHTTLGIGAFAHESLIASFGRISYSQFTQDHMPTVYPTGRAEVTFATEDGRELKGKVDFQF